ncbi:MAG: arginyltransferase [Myxococcales bacterium]|nr:arginyltransferase [Myxococcales bacterium]
MRVVNEFREQPRTCGYLDDRLAQLDHRVLLDVTPEELEQMLERGWRRFGPTYFRPGCPTCHECVTLRIPVQAFQPSESQRRALRRCRRFRAEWGRPKVDRARLSLYADWHRARESSRGWEPSPLQARDYFLQFAFPHPAGHELSLYEGDRLVLLGIYDQTPRALSAVYCFYHPEIARLSPGVANVMLGLERARSSGREHLYLGYLVAGSPSMRYKARFGPHQLLTGRPDPGEAPAWATVSSRRPPPR